MTHFHEWPWQRMSYALVMTIFLACVCRGYELYNTDPLVFGLETRLFGTPVDAVPLNTYDFGTGLVAVGDANLILTSSGNTVEAVALSLTDGTHFVTLQSERGLNPRDPPPGPRSLGMRPINPQTGGWDMQLRFHVDYRLGSRHGIILSPPPGFEIRFDMVTMSNNQYPAPPPGVLVIPGVTDFFPFPFGMVRNGPFGIDFGTIINATLAVPEPSGLQLAICVMLGLRRFVPRRRALAIKGV